MQRLLLLLFFLLLAPAAWAHPEDFCGSGLHPRTQICQCEDAGNNFCFCHSESESHTLIPSLRETLPVLLSYSLAQLTDPKTGVATSPQDRQQLAPASWIGTTRPRPPR